MFTGKLRWSDGGELEQEIAYQDYKDGNLVGSRAGWVPVPRETPKAFIEAKQERDDGWPDEALDYNCRHCGGRLGDHKDGCKTQR
jgi:hypothetical protein